MYPLIDKIHQLVKEHNLKAGQIFEQVITTAYLDLLKEGDQAIDLGAHRGVHLFPMAKKVGSKGKVYAFEPIPYLYQQLKAKCRHQNLRQVKLYPYAVGIEQRKSSFQHFKQYPAYSGLRQRETPFDPAEGELETIHVEQTALDHIFKSSTNITLIKLDIEGGELHALMGAKRLIQHDRPIIIFESGNQASARTYGYSQDDFFNFFDEMQLSVFTLDGTHFTRERWFNAPYCWEYYAIPNERLHLQQQLASYIHNTLDKFEGKL